MNKATKKNATKTAEDRIAAAVEVVKGICDNTFNCVGNGGSPRCKECKVGALYVALGVFDKKHVGNAYEHKAIRARLGSFGLMWSSPCKGCKHGTEKKTRLSDCKHFEPVKAVRKGKKNVA